MKGYHIQTTCQQRWGQVRLETNVEHLDHKSQFILPLRLQLDLAAKAEGS
jgi:hypothetical protein